MSNRPTFTPKLPLKISKCDYMTGQQMAIYAHDAMHVSPAVYSLLEHGSNADILQVLQNLPCLNLTEISCTLDPHYTLVLHTPDSEPLYQTARPRDFWPPLR